MSYYYSQEQDLDETFSRQITPFWQSQVIRGEFQGRQNVTIAYAYVIHPDPVDCVMISAGRVESLVKYQEVIFELYQNGFSVFIHDHRGQGLSGRMHTDKQRGYVDQFTYFIDDLQTFYEHYVAPNVTRPPLLLCHSMGCAIGAMYLLRNPRHFSRAVFSAPMFGIKTPLPDWMAVALVNSGVVLNNLCSTKPWYFLGQAPYIDVPFKLNTLTHSKYRYKLFRQQYQQHPDLQLGGVTYKWLQQAVAAMDHIERAASQITVPVLLLQAGADHVVDNQAQDIVARKIPNCDKRIIRNARHELLMEQDEQRRPVMEAIYNFFNQPSSH